MAEKTGTRSHLRKIPSVDSLLRNKRFEKWDLPSYVKKNLIRKQIEVIRKKNSLLEGPDSIESLLEESFSAVSQPGLLS